MLGTLAQRADEGLVLTPVAPQGDWDLHAFLFVDGVQIPAGRPHLLEPGSVLESNGSAFRLSGAARSAAARAEGFARHAGLGLLEVDGSRVRLRAPHLFDTSSAWAMARLAETDFARDAEVVELIPGRDRDDFEGWPDFIRQHLDALGPMAAKVRFLSPAEGPQCIPLPAISLQLGDSAPIRVVEPVDLVPGATDLIEAVGLPLPALARIAPWGSGARILFGALWSSPTQFFLNAATQPIASPARLWFALFPGDVLHVESGNQRSTVRVQAAAADPSPLPAQVRRRPIAPIAFDGAACETMTFQWAGGHQTVGPDAAGEFHAAGFPSVVAVAPEKFVVKSREAIDSRAFTWFEALPHPQHRTVLVLPRPSLFLSGQLDPSPNDNAWQVQLDMLLSLKDPAAEGLIALRRPDAAALWIPRLLGEFGLLWASGHLRGEHEAGFFSGLRLTADKTGALLLDLLRHPLMQRLTRVELPALDSAVPRLLPELKRRGILLGS